MNTQGQPVSNFYNYTNIGDFITDTEQTYHGTHTLGIMSGSYDGPVTVAKPWADPTVREPATYITYGYIMVLTRVSPSANVFFRAILRSPSFPADMHMIPFVPSMLSTVFNMVRLSCGPWLP